MEMTTQTPTSSCRTIRMCQPGSGKASRMVDTTMPTPVGGLNNCQLVENRRSVQRILPPVPMLCGQFKREFSFEAPMDDEWKLDSFYGIALTDSQSNAPATTTTLSSYVSDNNNLVFLDSNSHNNHQIVSTVPATDTLPDSTTHSKSPHAADSRFDRNLLGSTFPCTETTSAGCANHTDEDNIDFNEIMKDLCNETDPSLLEFLEPLPTTSVSSSSEVPVSSAPALVSRIINEDTDEELDDVMLSSTLPTTSTKSNLRTCVLSRKRKQVALSYSTLAMDSSSAMTSCSSNHKRLALTPDTSSTSNNVFSYSTTGASSNLFTTKPSVSTMKAHYQPIQPKPYIVQHPDESLDSLDGSSVSDIELVRRRRNNEASRRSRANKKQKMQLMEHDIDRLQVENKKFHTVLAQLDRMVKETKETLLTQLSKR